MAIPDYESLMLPVLKLAATDEVRIRDAIERISDQLGLTEEERATLIPSGSISVIGNRVHGAKTCLKQAGLVEQPRRAWYKATPRGLEVLAKYPDRIDNTVLMQFPEFTEFRKRSRSASELASADNGLAPAERNGHAAAPRNPSPCLDQPPRKRLRRCRPRCLRFLPRNCWERCGRSHRLPSRRWSSSCFLRWVTAVRAAKQPVRWGALAMTAWTV